MRTKITAQAEDYLKALYSLEQVGKITTQALADHLNFAPASVTQMIKKLAENGLVIHQPYQGAILTEAGRKIALEIIRHHRLLETYLHQALGYALEDIHTEAQRLEHHISETFEARIAAMLGNPTHDPHGDPIPTLDGVLPNSATRPLHTLGTGERAIIGRIMGQSQELLKQLVQLKLLPKTQVDVIKNDLYAGILTININGQDMQTLSFQAAQYICVYEPNQQGEAL